MKIQTKHPLASRTLWGGLILFVVSVAPLFGIDVSDIDVEKLSGAIAAIVGVVLVFVGRFKASKPIRVGQGNTTPMIACALLALALSACAVTKAETPEQRVYGLNVEYTNAARLIIGYARSDLRNETVLDHLKRLDQVAYDALTAARVAVQQGDAALMPSALAGATSAIGELMKYIEQKGLSHAATFNGHWNYRKAYPVGGVGDGRCDDDAHAYRSHETDDRRGSRAIVRRMGCFVVTGRRLA